MEFRYVAGVEKMAIAGEGGLKEGKRGRRKDETNRTNIDKPLTYGNHVVGILPEENCRLPSTNYVHATHDIAIAIAIGLDKGMGHPLSS